MKTPQKKQPSELKIYWKVRKRLEKKAFDQTRFLCKRLLSGINRAEMYRLPTISNEQLGDMEPRLSTAVTRLQGDTQHPTFFDFRSASEVRVYRCRDPLGPGSCGDFDDGLIVIKRRGITHWYWAENYPLTSPLQGSCKLPVLEMLTHLLSDQFTPSEPRDPSLLLEQPRFYQRS